MNMTVENNLREWAGKETNFRMASHFPSVRNLGGFEAYRHMFVEDLSSILMPLKISRHERQDVKVVFSGDAPEIERALEVISDFCEHDSSDQLDLICDAVNSIARDVAWTGTAFYEIKRNLKNEKKYFFVKGFVGPSFVFPFLSYVQFVPQADRQFFNNQKFLTCPWKDVFTITIPRELGGPATYKKLLSQLEKSSQHMPLFYKEDLEKSFNDKYYDANKYLGDRKKLAACLAKDWGWNVRDYSNKDDNEYFHVYRYVRFQWARSVFREHLLKTVNELLTKLSIKTSFHVEGLMNSNEILKIQSEMEAGRSDFINIVKYFRTY